MHQLKDLKKSYKGHRKGNTDFLMEMLYLFVFLMTFDVHFITFDLKTTYLTCNFHHLPMERKENLKQQV